VSCVALRVRKVPACPQGVVRCPACPQVAVCVRNVPYVSASGVRCPACPQDALRARKVPCVSARSRHISGSECVPPMAPWNVVGLESGPLMAFHLSRHKWPAWSRRGHLLSSQAACVAPAAGRPSCLPHRAIRDPNQPPEIGQSSSSSLLLSSLELGDTQSL